VYTARSLGPKALLKLISSIFPRGVQAFLPARGVAERRQSQQRLFTAYKLGVDFRGSIMIASGSADRSLRCVSDGREQLSSSPSLRGRPDVGRIGHQPVHESLYSRQWHAHVHTSLSRSFCMRKSSGASRAHRVSRTAFYPGAPRQRKVTSIIWSLPAKGSISGRSHGLSSLAKQVDRTEWPRRG